MIAGRLPPGLLSVLSVSSSVRPLSRGLPLASVKQQVSLYPLRKSVCLGLA